MSRLSSALLLLATIATSLLVSQTGMSEENTGDLFASMKIKIVPEALVCQLPDGYNSIGNGVRCPDISLSYVEDLHGIRGRDGRDFTETQPIKPGENITLDNNLSDALDSYYDLHLEDAPLRLAQRKSAIFIFTLHGSHPKLNITINAVQRSSTGCHGQVISEKPLIQNYQHTILENEQSFFYHAAADTIIPCSKVEWKLDARNISSNEVYESWIFRTQRSQG